MKRTLSWALGAGLALASGLTGFSHTAAAASLETNPAITIHIYNYAGVARKTLAEAEEVATRIFREAGVETRWTDMVLTAENNQENSAIRPNFTLDDIQLSIFPRLMSDRSGTPDNVMGLAPGNGPDRRIVYVFDGNVNILSWRMLSAHSRGQMEWQISKARILGHAIAHELGHLLLNQQVHSAHGIMRGGWGLALMRDAAYGMLLFTRQQGEFLRADVRRRNTRQDIPRAARDFGCRLPPSVMAGQNSSTSPIPPAPICATTSYEPSRVPEASDITSSPWELSASTLQTNSVRR